MMFNLEGAYQTYLKRVGLKETEMPEIQRVQTKEAFMAGMSSMADIFTGGIPELSDEDAMTAIDEVHKQLVEYWKNRIK